MPKVEQVRQMRNGRMRNVGYRAFIGEHATGIGTTQTMAKDNALVYAEAVLTGHYNPTVVRLGDHIAFVFREPSGWHTTHIRTAGDYPEGSSVVYGNGADATEAEAIRRCKMHMAQNAFDPKNDHLAARQILMFVHPADVSDLKQWIGFQRAWHAISQARDWSMSTALADNRIHEWASRQARTYAPIIDIDSPDWIVNGLPDCDYEPSTFHIPNRWAPCPCIACEAVRQEAA